MNPFGADWEIVWRPTWPGLGPCIVSGDKHTMSRVDGFWTCTACYCFFAEGEHDALADWHMHAMRIAQLVPRMN